ncbi:MAG: RnfABCDGE type electron transport complex subunit B [Francisellaceae bacterium]
MIVSIEDIDTILPQTQCTKCGYKDCYDYAKAITNGEKHNRCPPGGQAGVDALGTLLQRPTLKLDTTLGEEKPRELAVIDEDLCIGCTKCIDACPVDAIAGAKKQMHSVIRDECTGCELCLSPCPMDCIRMVVLDNDKQPAMWPKSQQQAQKAYFRERHNAKLKRLARQSETQYAKHQSQVKASHLSINKKDYIQQALMNYRTKKQNTASAITSPGDKPDE